MSTSNIKLKFEALIARIAGHAHHSWFPALLGLMAAIDHFVIVIPSDGLLVSSIFLAPKKWFRNFVGISIGSAIGASILAVIIHHFGMSFIDQMWPEIKLSSFWPMSVKLLNDHGLWGLFLLMASPLMQQPGICLVAISDHKISSIALVILAGKSVKYLLMSWIASKFPHMILRSKLLGSEVQEIQVATEHQHQQKEHHHP